MRHLFTLLLSLLFFIGEGFADNMPVTMSPVSVNPDDLPPPKRSVAYVPTVTLDGSLLTIEYPASGDVTADILENGELVWSETASFGMFTLPELQDGTTYTLVVTINGRSWGGVFTYVTP